MAHFCIVEATQNWTRLNKFEQERTGINKTEQEWTSLFGVTCDYDYDKEGFKRPTPGVLSRPLLPICAPHGYCALCTVVSNGENPPKIILLVVIMFSNSTLPSTKPSLKIRTSNAICWNSLGLFRDCGLNYISFMHKTFLFFKIES